MAALTKLLQTLNPSRQNLNSGLCDVNFRRRDCLMALENGFRLVNCCLSGGGFKANQQDAHHVRRHPADALLMECEH